MALSECRFEKIDGKETFHAAFIVVHDILPSLVGHEMIGDQALSVAALVIAHEFIHLLIGHKYGKKLTPKGPEIEKFKSKHRYRLCYRYERFLIGLLMV